MLSSKSKKLWEANGNWGQVVISGHAALRLGWALAICEGRRKAEDKGG
jgi:hypothetical protein